MEDQHKERKQEEEPTDQRKEEEAAGNPEEAKDRRKEEEQPEVAKPEEPKDQRKEEEEPEEGNKSGELTGQRKEEEPEVDNKSGELTSQRKEEEPEVDNKSGGLTNERKAEPVEEKETERSSEQDSMEVSSPFVHPCSQLLQYLARACARCLGMPDPFDGARPSAAPAASLNSSREVGVAAVNKAGDSTGVYYMQEVITRVWVRLRRPRPGGGNPREGPGGNGGVHH